jgi:RNA polymerase sigma-70 factor (ECF subfamily)
VKIEKLSTMRLHLPLMSMSADVIAAKATPTKEASAREMTDAQSFEAIYAKWFHDVSRWIRAFGGLDADLDDLAQEVFLIVRRKLPKFEGGNLAGWLYRITQRTVRDYRRRAWYRGLLAKRHVEGRPERESTAPEPDPSEMLERREAERLLVQILGKMSETRRTAFILFEIEGYSGEEIANLEEVPVNTVWTRLHHARKEFYMLIDRERTQGRLD